MPASHARPTTAIYERSAQGGPAILCNVWNSVDIAHAILHLSVGNLRRMRDSDGTAGRRHDRHVPTEHGEPVQCTYARMWPKYPDAGIKRASAGRSKLPKDVQRSSPHPRHCPPTRRWRGGGVKRSTIFVTDLLHHNEGAAVSKVIRRCKPAEYRIWLKCMTGTYPVQTYLKRIGIAKSPICPHCPEAVPESLTHFACVCPKFREARTSAHNQVRDMITSFLSNNVGPECMKRPRW
jgi:hypothetical protein